MAKREKQVYGTNEIAHLWANQTQESGSARNSGGNFYYSGADIYSYGSHFRIATLIDIPETVKARIAEAYAGTENNPFTANKLVLFTTRTYSNTTAGHIQLTRSAVTHLPKLYMPKFVEELEAPENEWDYAAWNRAHAENLAYYINSAQEAKGNAERARASWKIAAYVGEVHSYVAQARDYMKLYGLYVDNSGKSTTDVVPVPFPEVRNAMIELSTYERVYVAKDPVTEEKREKARASRERARLKKVEQLKNEWLAGAGKHGFTPEHWYGYKAERKHVADIEAQYGVLLRLIDNGELVETTKHATVPTKDAKRLLRYVRLVKETNVDMPEIVAKGLLTVGPYTVNRITKDGDLIVGCHSILNSEIERFAKEQGWMEEVTVESLSN